jgi:DNA-binding MarR family transcriptional regulator/N-acetylglutamate synthase-like GNAT family acetyltransferase
MAEADFDQRVAAVRRFNRFYTKQIGLLHEHLLKSPFSLTEARVIYELAHRERATATELGRELGLDAGYLSRILRRFAARRLIDSKPSKTDGRQRLLSLAKRGQRAFARLNRDSHEEIGALLGRLSQPSQDRLVAAMHTIEGLVGTEPGERVPYVLRSHQPGDMGWVVRRHGVLYAQEYGWDERFEALVAEIVAKFIKQYDAKRERCWIAEVDGENVGSVFCVKESEAVARLRLLLVEPRARGLGIGTRLVSECVGFAREVGYRKLTLWTNDVLDAARHIYEKTGFHLVHEEPHHSFGHDLVGQTWEREL